MTKLFQSLKGLMNDKSSLALMASLQKDGRIQVVVVPKGDFKEDALKTPLTLTGTAEELDEQFIDAVSKYQEARTSLQAQVESTVAILDEAKKAQAEAAKAKVKSASKAEPKAVKAGERAGVGGGVDDHDDLDEESGGGATGGAGGEPAGSAELSLF